MLGMNRVPVARLGPILSQDGITASRNLSKPLPAPFPPAWGPKILQHIKHTISGKLLWGALAELREALGELWEALEELWEALYKLTPDQPHSGRYVNYNILQ